MPRKKICESITDLVGNTPILALNKFKENKKTCANIFAKIEYFNPSGSVKDRIAKAMVIDAINKGLLKENSVIIEPTSGNTGIGLAFIGASMGYKVILVMPESMSVERRKLIAAYGAEIVLTKAFLGMQGTIDKANELQKNIPNSIILGQFDNLSNPAIHRATTGPEIWEAMDGKVDFFVAGIGTGGTITGVGEYLKKKNRNIKIIAVEPFSSPLLSESKAGPHKIQGIGANFIPSILNIDVIDEIICIKDEEAVISARELVKTEGFLVGISSGAVIAAATQLANREENKGKNIVVILPDNGERYLSTSLYEF